jgi:hypothetical protein
MPHNTVQRLPWIVLLDVRVEEARTNMIVEGWLVYTVVIHV